MDAKLPFPGFETAHGVFGPERVHDAEELASGPDPASKSLYFWCRGEFFAALRDRLSSN
jgi:hypothetical protein